MSLIIALILGGLIGWAASALLGRHEGVVASVVIGIIGAIIGNFISMLFTGSHQAALALGWSSLLWSFIGAIILVAILNAVRGGQRRHSL